MKAPLVTIVTVSYNSEAVIAATMESVLNQTYPRLEYIIVDGKSSDRTTEIAEGYREAFEKKGYKLRIISEPDGGIYDAMNKGIRMATGEIIGLLNTGDTYVKRAVFLSAMTMIREGADITFGDLAMHRSNGGVLIKKARVSKTGSSRHWNHPTMFVRADVYKAHPFRCTGGVADDFCCYLEMKNMGHKIVTIPRVLVHYEMGGASSKKDLRTAVERTKSRYEAYRYNGYSIFNMAEYVLTEVGKFLLG